MTKKIPKSIVVHPHVFQIDTSEAARERCGIQEAYATCNKNELTIDLNDGSPDSIIKESLIHEALHALWDQTPLRETQHENEEEIVTALATRLYGFVLDNPKFMEYILEK